MLKFYPDFSSITMIRGFVLHEFHNHKTSPKNNNIFFKLRNTIFFFFAQKLNLNFILDNLSPTLARVFASQEHCEATIRRLFSFIKINKFCKVQANTGLFLTFSGLGSRHQAKYLLPAAWLRPLIGHYAQPWPLIGQWCLLAEHELQRNWCLAIGPL